MSNAPSNEAELLAMLGRTHRVVLAAIGIELTPDEATEEMRQAWREVSVEFVKAEMLKAIRETLDEEGRE